MRTAALLVIALCGCASLRQASAEKGDTYIAVMSAKGLPPNSGYSPPTGKLAKEEVHVLLNDNGITSNNTIKFTYSVDFPSEKYLWSSIGLVNTQRPGAPPYFYVANFTEPSFFVTGNYSFGEVSDGLIGAGLCPDPFAGAFCTNYISMQDNTTYALTILDPVNKIAIGGVLEYRGILAFGNGSTDDTAGTSSELKSDIVYVATLDNVTVSFDHGYTSGYTPGNASCVAILQYINQTYFWELSTQFERAPASIEIRFFETLAYQPLLLNLTPDEPFPVPPRHASKDAVFSGNFTEAAMVASMAQLGKDWWTMNFNNTPSTFMLNYNNQQNATVLGFIYNANQQPPPQPVIKGGSGVLTGTESPVKSEIAAWVTVFFMLFLIVFWATAYRTAKTAARDKARLEAALLAPLKANAESL